MDQFDWTDERVAELKRLWLELGLSASQCAAQLGGGITRSAVIGKVHRLKLTRTAPKAPRKVGLNPAGVVSRAGRKSGVAVLPGGRSPLKARGDSPAALAKADERAVPVSTVDGDVFDRGHGFDNDSPVPLIGLMQLGPHTCRWPVGDPRLPGFGFCGCHTDEGSVYCPSHRRRASEGPVPVARVRTLAEGSTGRLALKTRADSPVARVFG